MLGVFDILIISFSGVLLASMFTDFLEDDMIFSFWGKFLANRDWWILKPLGGCFTCTTIWAVALMYFLITFYPVVASVLFALSLGHWIRENFNKHVLL